MNSDPADHPAVLHMRTCWVTSGNKLHLPPPRFIPHHLQNKSNCVDIVVVTVPPRLVGSYHGGRLRRMDTSKNHRRWRKKGFLPHRDWTPQWLYSVICTLWSWETFPKINQDWAMHLLLRPPPANQMQLGPSLCLNTLMDIPLVWPPYLENRQAQRHLFKKKKRRCSGTRQLEVILAQDQPDISVEMDT